MINLSPLDHLDVFSNTTHTISEVTVSSAIAKVLEAGANVTIVTNPNGTITITPTFVGLSVIYVDGTTVAGDGTAASPMHMIGLPDNIKISPPIIEPLTYNTYASIQLDEFGGNGIVTYAILSGALPSGMTLSAAGHIMGTPAAIGLYNFIIAATDSLGIRGEHSYSLYVLPVALTLSPLMFPNAFVGQAYSAALSATGGTGTYTYTLLSSLPEGLTFTGNLISGMPSSVSSTYFTIKVTDSVGNFGTKNYTLTSTGAIVIGPLSLNSGAAGAYYSQHISANGGSNTGFIYAIASGSLPAGISLTSNNGLLTGRAQVMGSSSFTITVTDSAGNVAAHDYSIIINNALSLNPTSFPDGSISTSYSQPITASGGSGGGYVFSLTAGALPAGFSLINGVISGAPEIAGQYSFTITVEDSSGSYLSQNYTINIDSVTLTLSSLVSSSGHVGSAYSQSVHASGGTGSYTSYWISSGIFPPGLSFSGNAITGTPTNSGSYPFSISVVDSAGDTGVKSYIIDIT